MRGSVVRGTRCSPACCNMNKVTMQSLKSNVNNRQHMSVAALSVSGRRDKVLSTMKVRATAQAPPPVQEDRDQDKKGFLEAFTGGGIEGIEPSPLVEWGSDISADMIPKLKQEQSKGADGVPVVSPSEGVAKGDLAAEEADLCARKEEILNTLAERGMVHFTGYALMKDAAGYHKFYDALGLDPCLDPIHSVAARPVSSAEHKIYEAVNKPSRSNYVVGMHNEMVGTQAPRYAGFVCFKPAEEGGEFWTVGGNDLFHELSTPLLQKMQKQKVIFSVVEFPMAFLKNLDKQIVENVAKPAIKALMGFAVGFKVDFDVFFRFVDQGYDGEMALQGYASPQPVVIEDPVSKLPVVFCNIHSHSKFLRDERQKSLGALQETTGASKANKTDVSYGDDTPFTDEELNEWDRATMKCVNKIDMKAGDVVLLDNYRTMHGRGTFKGSRHNAVAWFSALNK